MSTEFKLTCVQGHFRRLRQAIDSGMDLLAEARVEDAHNTPARPATLRANVSALEGVLDRLQKELVDTRHALGQIEDGERQKEGLA